MARDKTPVPRGPFPRILNSVIAPCGCGWAFVEGITYQKRWQHCGVAGCEGVRRYGSA